jgi:hypothetical protein
MATTVESLQKGPTRTRRRVRGCLSSPQCGSSRWRTPRGSPPCSSPTTPARSTRSEWAQDSPGESVLWSRTAQVIPPVSSRECGRSGWPQRPQRRVERYRLHAASSLRPSDDCGLWRDAPPAIAAFPADEPGTGKTIMAGLYLREMQRLGLVQRAIVVCPANLASKWIADFTRFSVAASVISQRTQSARTRSARTTSGSCLSSWLP